MLRIRRGLLAVLMGVAAVVAGLAPAPSAAAISAPAVVFKQGDGGYACVRVPAIVRTNAGTLLAFAEGRKDSCSDSAASDVILRRSTDGGRTWSAIKVVAVGNGVTRHNPTPVVDMATGRIVLLTVQEYSSLWVQYSTATEDGNNWSLPKNITQTLPGWNAFITGPGHGIQLTRGAHAGRLVVGMNYAANGNKGGVLLYSDNAGDTWQVGANSNAAAPALQVQELSVFERPDGSLYALARNEGGTSSAQTAYAVSTDAGESWQAKFAAVNGLVVPNVQSSTLVMRATDAGSDYNRVLVAAPANSTERRQMAIRSSFNGGATWQSASQGTTVHAAAAAYSDLVAVDGNQFGVLYEAGDGDDPYASVRFTRFTEADLDLPPNPTSLTATQNSAALLTTNPDQRHIFAVSPGGALNHWWQEPTWVVKQGTWATGVAGKVGTFVDGPQQHAFVRGTDGSLQHRWWDPASSSLKSESWAGASAIAGSPTVFVTESQQHVFARGIDGSLRHWWYDHNSDLTQSQTWAAAGVLAGDPVAIRYSDQQHVWAAGTDGALHHWWWDRDVPVVPRHESWGGSAVGGVTAFIHNGQQHVFARDTAGALAHWFWDPGTQVVSRQIWGGGMALKGDPISFVDGTQQHVFARDANNRLAHWWWEPGYTSVRFGTWQGTVNSDPIALVVGGQQHAFGAASDGTLNHWWWDKAAGVQLENWGGSIAVQ